MLDHDDSFKHPHLAEYFQAPKQKGKLRINFMVQGSAESFGDPDTHTHSVGSSRHYPIIVIAL